MKIMKNMKKLQLLLLGMLLGMPVVVQAENVTAYCYGQVTAYVEKGHENRGYVYAAASYTSDGSANWQNFSTVQNYQALTFNLPSSVGTGQTVMEAGAMLYASPLYLHAKVVADGYYFEGWKNKNGTIVSTKDTLAVREGWNVRSTPYGEGATVVYSEMGPFYASFRNLTIGEAEGDLVIHPTSKTETYEKTITVSVPHADSKNDVIVSGVESISGTGVWSELYNNNWTCADGVVTIHYTFNGDGAAGVSKGEIVVSSKGGESRRVIKLQANFANIASGNAPLIVCAPGEEIQAVATFATQYVKDIETDFPAGSAVFSNAKWSVDDYTYADNKVTVLYTFNAPAEEGVYEANLTLTTSAGVNKTIPCKVIVENESDNEAAAYNADGEIEQFEYLNDAIEFANDPNNNVDTIRLLSDIIIEEEGYQLAEITRTVVLDLHGKHIVSTNGIQVLTIGYVDEEEGVDLRPQVTIADTRAGGSIKAQADMPSGEVTAIVVDAGTLTVATDSVIAENTSEDEGAAALGIIVYEGARCELRGDAVVLVSAKTSSIGVRSEGLFTVVSGEVSVQVIDDYAVALEVMPAGTCEIDGGSFMAQAGSQAYGLMAEDETEVTIRGGTVYSHAEEEAYALYSYVAVNIDNGIFTAVADNAVAYAFYQDETEGASVISGGKFLAEADEEFADIYVAEGSTISIAGGIYSSKTNLNEYAELKVLNLNPICADYEAGYRYTVGSNPNAAVIQVGDMYFPTLVNALSYVNNNPSLISTIVLLDDANLPSGKFTLPANATLIIPYYEGQNSIDVHPKDTTVYTTPSLFRTLTLEAGARLDIFGKVQVGGKQCSVGQLGGKNGMPTDSYGMIYMEEGSSMTVEGGAQLYAWGYITGARDEEGKYQCGIDVKRGGFVHEMMQITDWRGGSATFNFNENVQKVFPLNQYFIQNIEVPATFRPGSKELIDGAVNATVGELRSFPFVDVLLIGGHGQKCMFSMDTLDMSEDTWVRKSYDVVNDKQVYEINNSAHVSSLVLTLNVIVMTVSFNSALYVLPLTNNMKIHLLTGTLGITQDVLLMPGAEIEVDKEATAYITSGKKLYVMDAEEWEPFAAGKNTYPIPYSPSWVGGVCPRNASDALEDAKINVHGTFRVDGYVYTTASGANIFSTNDDAGTFLFNNDAPTTPDVVYLANNTEGTYKDKPSNSAWLRNGDDSFVETAGVLNGETYAYYVNQWRKWKTDGCFAVDKTDDDNWVYYAKPADYVALAAGEPDAADHLYHSADLTRTFILMEPKQGEGAEGCQWWEVTKVANEDDLYYCEKNNVYYFYDEAADYPQWKEKVLTVRWLDSDGATLLHKYTNVHYGDKAQYFHDDPVKPADGYKTYDFIGWLPEPAEHLTSDASYVAQYRENVKECTITFRDVNGNMIEQNQVAIGTIPECSGAPTGIGELYDWYPPIHAVTADEEYMLVAREIKTNYTIMFLDWDNTILWEGEIAAGTTIDIEEGENEFTFKNAVQSPDYGESFDAPMKANNAGRQYTFAGWSPALATVNGDAIYTAVYQESMQTFVITTNATGDGAVAITPAAANNEYAYGSTITITATPNTGSYLKQWQDSLVAASRTITVTGNATYTATFSNVYNVALFTNGGSILAHGRSTYTYDAVNDTPLPGAGDLRHDEDATRTALGWYAKADFSGAMTWAIPAGTAKNLVYYLKWSEPEEEPAGETYEDQVGRSDPNGSGYYATFYSSACNYIVPDGYTAYKAVIVGERIRLEAIGDIIPAGEGVLLHSETYDEFDLVPTAENAPSIGHNDFTGTDTALPFAEITGGTPYVFSAVNGVIGFYKLSSTATIPAHRAYVLWSGGNSAPPRMFRIDRPNVTTDIEDMETIEPVKQKGIYSILGHELAEPIHGTINIIDGELKYIP